MSWKYSQAGDTRAQQAAIAGALRAASRSSKFTKRRAVGYGAADPSRSFGNLGLGMFKNTEQSYARRNNAYRPAVIVARRGENKTFDVGGTAIVAMTASTDTPVATSAGGYLLNGAAASSAIVLNQVPLGNSSTTRVGRKLTMKAVHLRIKVFASTVAAATVGTNTAVQICLVLVRKNDRTTTALPPHNAVFRGQDMQLLTNIDNADRFKILRKWDCWPLGDGDTAGDRTGQSSFLFDEYVKIPYEVSWNQADTTGTFDNMEEGALCLYVRGSQPLAIATNALYVVSRLYYSDV